eukprot:TRINITY_DN827_c0_g1_i1.p1 TRINITY_DN827_c0_g1~~TRINITY_DN827_c0_g1_i1.p1  ORF type:complete len:220 (+),score=67.63 TRINITY_DN827_c0_g1_i1:186-845(+)
MPIVSNPPKDASSGLPVLSEGEYVLATFPHVTMYFAFNPSSVAGGEGEGTLFVTSQRVVWLSSFSAEKGYALTFPYIMLHAISRDISSGFPHPCIYCQLDSEEDDAGMMDGSEDEEEGSENEVEGGEDSPLVDTPHKYSECRFVPNDPSQLQAIYDALSSGAVLNPDPENEGEGDFFYDEDEVQTNLERLEGMITMPTPEEMDELGNEDQFDDADEDDQ